MKLSAQFDFSQVDHERDNTVRLLLTVEAPAIDWIAKRPKICVLPVIDVSGSMSGDKLRYAKQACKKLIEQLKSGDYSGLVAFGSKAQVVIPPAEVTQKLKTQLLKAVDDLTIAGDTNFSEAITKALGSLANLDLAPNILHRVIFFTDGQPTAGITDEAMLKTLLTNNLGTRSASFFGYGVGDACDQNLLTELSQLGKGNYAYVQDPDDALAAFGRELGGLLSTYGSDLRLVVEPRNGHTIERVVTALGTDRQLGGDAHDPTELALELGEILAEETRHVVLECSVKKQDKALPRDFTLFNVRATCRRITQGGEKASEEASAAARIRFVRPEDAQKTATPEVDQVVALHQLARAQREAEEQASKGMFFEAQARMDAFSKEVTTRGLVNLANVASNLGHQMRTPGSYASSEGYRVSLGRGVLRAAAVSSYSPSAAMDLQSVMGGSGGTFSNSAQAAYVDVFTGVDDAPQAPVVPFIATNLGIAPAVAPSEPEPAEFEEEEETP